MTYYEAKRTKIEADVKSSYHQTNLCCFFGAGHAYVLRNWNSYSKNFLFGVTGLLEMLVDCMHVLIRNSIAHLIIIARKTPSSGTRQPVQESKVHG